jgi:hypothetical protein
MGEIMIQEYEAAAGRGCVYELRMRFLCEHVPALAEQAHANGLGQIEPRVAEVFAAQLSPEERHLLREAKRLRDKVLHCEFHSARERLAGLGYQPDGAGVVGAKLDTGETISVRGSTTREAGVFGWLLELWSSGDLRNACDVFTRAGALAERLMVEADAAAADREPPR